MVTASDRQKQAEPYALGPLLAAWWATVRPEAASTFPPAFAFVSAKALPVPRAPAGAAEAAGHRVAAAPARPPPLTIPTARGPRPAPSSRPPAGARSRRAVPAVRARRSRAVVVVLEGRVFRLWIGVSSGDRQPVGSDREEPR